MERHFDEIYKKLQFKVDRSSNKEKYATALKAFQQTFRKNSIDEVDEINEVTVIPNKEQARVHGAIATFANDLCARLIQKNPTGSFSISPVSLIGALGMCLHIIHPEKKGEFIEKIGLKGLSEMEAHEAIAAVLKNMGLPKKFKNGTMEVAQGLALLKENIVSQSLQKLVKETYGADIIVSANLQNEVKKWVEGRRLHLCRWLESSCFKNGAGGISSRL